MHLPIVWIVNRSHQPHMLPKEQKNHTSLMNIIVTYHTLGTSTARKFSWTYQEEPFWSYKWKFLREFQELFDPILELE